MKTLILNMILVSLFSCRAHQVISKRSQRPHTDGRSGDKLPSEIDPSPGDNDSQTTDKSRPIIWGFGAGGIDFSTNHDQAKKILGEPKSIEGNIDSFPDGIDINWSEEPMRTPSRIAIKFGYPGSLLLPTPFPEATIGTPLSALFPIADDFDLVVAMVKLGVLLEGDQKEEYNCVAALKCSIAYRDDGLSFHFSNGSWVWDQFRTLQELVMTRRIFNRLVFGQSVAGLTLDITKDKAELLLGKSVSQKADGNLFYDDGNVMIQWLEDDTPNSIVAGFDYQGKLVLPLSTAREISFGSSLKGFLPVDGQNIEELARLLYRIYIQADIDCLSIAVCSIAPYIDGTTAILLPTGFLAVDNPIDMNLRFVGIGQFNGADQ